MRRHPALKGLLLLCAFAMAPLSPCAAAESAEGPARRTLLVKTRGGPAARRLDEALKRQAGDRARATWRSSLTAWAEVTLEEGEDAESAMARLARDPAIEAVETDRIARASQLPPDASIAQWWVQNTGQVVSGVAGSYDADIDAPDAWELSRGDASILVGLLDTGVHTDHPDLSRNLRPGYDFINDDSDTWDDAGFGHGTPIAGIIGAVGDNGMGIAGINWQVGLIPVKVCDARGDCPFSRIAAGIEYAVSRGARVLNLSLTCDEHQDPASGMCGASRPGACNSRMLRDALAAAGRAGVLVVTAAGNCGASLDDSTRAYPCSYPLGNVLCVGATDARDELAPFSNYGTRAVKVAAPGAGVLSLSTRPSASVLWDGTSFSAPMAAGVAALLLSRSSSLTPPALSARIARGDLLASMAGRVTGGARLNAALALGDLFESPRAISAEAGSAAGLTGDFDGDGRLDALRPDPPVGYSVARGTGEALGPFSLWSAVAPASAHRVADVNGDGRQDLVRPGPGGVEVLLSDGGSFSAPQRWSTASWTSTLQVADVDGDGRGDLVRQTGRGGYMVSVSSGQAFQASMRWSLLSAGDAWTLAEVDGDGRADLVRSVRGALDLSVSTGSSFAPPRSAGAVPRTRLLRAGDVDGDGDDDLVLQGADGCWSVQIHEAGLFAPARPWACGAPGTTWALGRFDADSRSDLLTMAASAGWRVMLSRH